MIELAFKLGKIIWKKGTSNLNPATTQAVKKWLVKSPNGEAYAKYMTSCLSKRQTNTINGKVAIRFVARKVGSSAERVAGSMCVSTIAIVLYHFRAQKEKMMLQMQEEIKKLEKIGKDHQQELEKIRNDHQQVINELKSNENDCSVLVQNIEGVKDELHLQLNSRRAYWHSLHNVHQMNIDDLQKKIDDLQKKTEDLQKKIEDLQKKTEDA